MPNTLLSVNNYFYRRGGAESVFIEHNRLFENMGWNVVVFSMSHPRNDPSKWSEYFVSNIEFGHEYSFFEKLLRAPKVIYSVEAGEKLKRLFNLCQPDICHCHNIYHHISPSILPLLKRRGVPTVLTLHDLKLACPSYRMLGRKGICELCGNGKLYNVIRHRCIKDSLCLSALVFVESCVHRLLQTYTRNVDRFVVPSSFYKKKLAEWGVVTERVVHIPNFIDVDAMRPEFSAGKAFLYFGRLSAEKGLMTLVKAASLAKIPLWIAGAGDQESHLRELAEHLDANVSFLGYLTGELLYSAVRAARATVLPSEWYENGPVSIMESYALGTPVIASDIGGIPELVRDGETGVTFHAGSVESLGKALLSFKGMSDAQLADMGKCGRLWVEAAFTRKHYETKMLDLYAGLGVRV